MSAVANPNDVPETDEVDSRSDAEKRADNFFLTDFVNTDTFKQMHDEISAIHPADGDDEFPDEYWDELARQQKELFQRCAVLSEKTIEDNKKH